MALDAVIEGLEIQDAIEARVKANGLAWFVPTGKQSEIIEAVGSGEYFIVVFSAANAIGKTALMANIVGNVIYGSQSKWFNSPLYKRFPYPKRARIATTPKNLEEIGAIQTELARWLPFEKYSCDKGGKSYVSKYRVGGWVMDLMSYEQDPSEYESATLGLMMFDEPPPLKVLHATIARLRKGGVILIFMTPLDEGGEILDELEGRETLVYNGQEVGKVKIIYGEIEDACEEHGVRGYLKHSDIVQMLSFYDEDEKDARAKGKPIHLTGRIFPEFEIKEPYVVDDFVIPADWPRIMVVDPHEAIPFAITWAAIDRTDEVWIYDEFPAEDLDKAKGTLYTFIDYNRIIREKEGRDRVGLRLIDPYFGGKKSIVTGRTVKDEFREFGFLFEDGSTDGLEVGHLRVKDALRYAKSQAISSVSQPRLHILRRCRNNWRSMYYYKRKASKSGEVRNEVVLDQTFKHFCDNMRHLFTRHDLSYEAQRERLGGGSYRPQTVGYMSV